MKKHKDAFGQAIYDRLNGKGGFSIVEREDGYFDMDNLLDYYFADYGKWTQDEKKAIRFAKGKVIDIGCGAGRVGLYLQKKGFDVLGVDVSHLALKSCRQRGFKNVKKLSITELSRKVGLFDTIIMYGNNLGLLGNRKRAKWLLKRFYRMTSPGAYIIAQGLDPYKTKDQNHLEYHKFNRGRGRMSGQIRIRIRYKKCLTEWFDYLFVSKNELKQILHSTGWKIKCFVNSGGPIYIAIIEKEKNKWKPKSK